MPGQIPFPDGFGLVARLKRQRVCIVFPELVHCGLYAALLLCLLFFELFLIRFIDWVKTNPVPLNSGRNYLTNSREVALSAVKVGKPTFNSQYDNGLYRYPICHDKGRFHSTQKPLAFMEELVRKHSNENDVVLDTFAGAATTLLAAKNQNRKYIGCEIDDEYYEKAKERLDE